MAVANQKDEKILHIHAVAPNAFFEECKPYPKVLLQYLWNKGYGTKEAVVNFLNANVSYNTSPFLLSELRTAVERVWQAILNEEKILVFGDYDADGNTSSVTMTEGLKNIGAIVEWDIPQREDGYGLSIKSLEKTLKHRKDIKLIITVDNGIKAKDTAEKLKSLDIDLIVTDHHDIDDKDYPSAAYAVINPKKNDGYPECHLSGCGVAYKFIQGLCLYIQSLISENKVPKSWLKNYGTIDLTTYPDNWLDMVTIGTIADMMPLIEENRAIIKRGLDKIRSGNLRLGLQALVDQTYTKDISTFGVETVGFDIAPMINAAGRIGDSRIAAKLFMSNDVLETSLLAQEAAMLNKQRKEIQAAQKEKLFEVIREQKLDEKPVIVAYLPECQHGIVGLLAASVTQDYNKPAIILTDRHDDNKVMFSGSARSIPGFNISQALSNVAHYLSSYGGHEGAAGLSIESKYFSQFYEELMAYSEPYLIDLEEKIHLIDMELPLGEISYQIIDIQHALEPLGGTLQKPTFVTKNVYVNEAKPLKFDSPHLSLSVSDNKGNSFKVLGWFKANLLKSLPIAPFYADIVYKLVVSTFGVSSIELRLESIRVSSENNVDVIYSKYSDSGDTFYFSSNTGINRQKSTPLIKPKDKPSLEEIRKAMGASGKPRRI